MEEDLGWGGFRFTGYDRHAVITAFADFRENWDLSEERHTLPAGFVLPATVAENFDALAAGRSEVAHVFHDAKDGHIDFFEHLDALADDAQRSFLRSGHDDAAVEWHGLAKRNLRIAGAGRQVDEQVVEFPPEHLREMNCWMVRMIIGPRQMTG